MTIPFFVQEFTSEMEDAAIHALRNESFVGGESVSKFEEEFADYIGTKYAVSVSSGNAALQSSLMALGIDDESRVITPTNSFIASANCIRMINARPILSDIDLKDGSIDIGSVSGADIDFIISPPGGHASDAVAELGGFFVMMNVDFATSESGEFNTSNDFRRIALLLSLIHI